MSGKHCKDKIIHWAELVIEALSIVIMVVPFLRKKKNRRKP